MHTSKLSSRIGEYTSIGRVRKSCLIWGQGNISASAISTISFIICSIISRETKVTKMQGLAILCHASVTQHFVPFSSSRGKEIMPCSASFCRLPPLPRLPRDKVIKTIIHREHAPEVEQGYCQSILPPCKDSIHQSVLKSIHIVNKFTWSRLLRLLWEYGWSQYISHHF